MRTRHIHFDVGIFLELSFARLSDLPVDVRLLEAVGSRTGIAPPVAGVERNDEFAGPRSLARSRRATQRSRRIEVLRLFHLSLSIQGIDGHIPIAGFLGLLRLRTQRRAGIRSRLKRTVITFFGKIDRDDLFRAGRIRCFRGHLNKLICACATRLEGEQRGRTGTFLR